MKFELSLWAITPALLIGPPLALLLFLLSPNTGVEGFPQINVFWL